MNVLRSDEHFYRNAERLIKERYTFYTSNYKSQSTEMYLVMTLLDVAVRLERTREMGDTTPLLERLKPLLNDVEKILEK